MAISFIRKISCSFSLLLALHASLSTAQETADDITLKCPEITNKQLGKFVDYGFIGVLIGSIVCFKGIFDALDIPLTYFDNCILAKRTKMFGDDLARHHLGRKIVSGIELTVGTLLTILSGVAMLSGAILIHERIQAGIKFTDM